MKRVITIALLLFFNLEAWAGHITGGEMYYTYLGFNNGLHRYSVTMKFYKRCNVSVDFPNPAIVSVFNKTNNERYADVNAGLTRVDNINLPINDPCISNPPLVCFDVARYDFLVEVPASAEGYVLASQINFRIAGINNLTPGYTGVGATYTAEIPGGQLVNSGPQNSSARFTGNDLVLVCTGNSFNYSFAATDPDGDELRYTFCSAYNSTANGGGTYASEPPPYPVVPYFTPGYSATQPMGSGISLNSNTGLIQGVAPEAGIYVVTVCVEETRNGIIIAVQRKDIQIYVADCSIASASLLPEYLLCGNSFSLSLINLSSSPVIASTDWEIKDRGGNLVYQFTGTGLDYSFADTGLYTVKLVINRNLPTCTDSTTALVRVYPGFRADFAVTGGCVSRPSFFSDSTRSIYGSVNSWYWDFGEPATSNDFSSLQNPIYTYPQTGIKNVSLIATDSRGCTDTAEKTITVQVGPSLTLAFRDTLICVNDNLVLQAAGTGNFSWTPSATLSDASSPSPRANPTVTTTYFVDLNDGGCTNRDTVRVRVVNFVTLVPMNDSTVCKGDTSQLRIVSDALQYSWAPAVGIIDPFSPQPFVITDTITTYTVRAVIGGCEATGSITLTPVPYPVADAGENVTVCYNASAQLNGTTDGNSWTWTPVVLLNDPSLLSPIASPRRTTSFVLSAYDTRGCPKPGMDTVLVTVLPRLNVSAGNDTAVITGQLLQLYAVGGIVYNWSPAANLSADNIPDPLAVFNTPSEGIQYRVTATDANGCSASDYIVIKVYRAGPVVFVPTAFTPNSDGLNDRLRPIAAGIRNIEYFSVFNLWGQLIFSTRQNGNGWDGKLNGADQPPGTYAWVVKGVDYTGKSYFQKGIFTLVR